MKKYGLWILAGIAILIVIFVLIGKGKNTPESQEIDQEKEVEKQAQEEMQANGYGLGMYYYSRLKELNGTWALNEIQGKTAPYCVKASCAAEIRSICTDKAFEQFKAYWEIEDKGDGYYTFPKDCSQSSYLSEQITLKEETENRITLSVQATQMDTKEKKEYPFVLVKVGGDWLVDNFIMPE